MPPTHLTPKLQAKVTGDDRASSSNSELRPETLTIDRGAELPFTDNGFNKLLSLDVSRVGRIDDGALGGRVCFVCKKEVEAEVTICLAEVAEGFVFSEEVES
jgi:hypothetical protein